ncbi:hypothetical protein BASA81_012801 [Batrachochytrium salamandrivorans]|nr:hypothetical protein BASA81_012801 [Batrachochytrium salamandrivorans]
MATRKWPGASGKPPLHHTTNAKRFVVLALSAFSLLVLIFASPSTSSMANPAVPSSTSKKITTLAVPLEDLEAQASRTPRQQVEDEVASNEAYPEPDLPHNGQAMKRVQQEVSAEDVPETPSQPDSDGEHKPASSELSNQDLFEDWEAFERAPIITSPEEAKGLKYREIVLQHERYYRNNKDSKLYVPRLRKDIKLTVSQFANRFVKRSQPVIVPFEAMRHLGFHTKSYTVDELLALYPNYKRTFVYKYGKVGTGELDLGPAVWALKQGEALRKTPAGRNFPRNTKISLDQLARLKVQSPPFVLPETSMLPPSLWFATKTSSTVFHSDCCDNYAMMILGTKRWTVTPPHEARILTPTCQGGLCWVKRLEHPDEHAKNEKEQELANRIQKVTFDLGPGEMLYLPTGFFHHVEQDGPTIMINLWTHGGPGFLRFLDGSLTQTMAELERRESAQVA